MLGAFGLNQQAHKRQLKKECRMSARFACYLLGGTAIYSNLVSIYLTQVETLRPLQAAVLALPAIGFGLTGTLFCCVSGLSCLEASRIKTSSNTALKQNLGKTREIKVGPELA